MGPTERRQAGGVHQSLAAGPLHGPEHRLHLAHAAPDMLGDRCRSRRIVAGGMEDDVDWLHRPSEAFWIGEVPIDPFEFHGGQISNGRFPAPQATHLPTAIQRPPRHLSADETGCTQHKRLASRSTDSSGFRTGRGSDSAHGVPARFHR